MIIAGTAVGAGMFSLPIAMSGIWFGWSVAVFLLTWFCMLLSGMMILEANLNYPVGSSFSTITRDLLGQGWNVVNGLSIAFVLYILTYAYISGGGSIIGYTLSSGLGVTLPEKLAGLLFALAVALVVWWSTRAVDRITTLMLGGMIITFGLSISGLLGRIQPAILFNSGEPDAVYWPYLLATLPFCLTSFGYHGNVPSLMKYYGKDPQRISRSLWIGTLIALAIYLLWQASTLGTIPREQFKGIIAGGSNVGTLVEYLHRITASDSLNALLTTFSNLAVASSFLGVTLPEKLAGLLFALAVALVVWWSTRAVDRITTLMLGGMIITFGLSISGLLGRIQPAILFNSGEPDAVYWPYLLATLPFCLTSFGYHGNVPSLMKYYGKDPQRISRSLWIGTLIALAIYLLWQASTLGTIPREQFKGIIAGGSNVGTLVEYLHRITASDSLNALLTTFSNLAVASSFLGVTLGLFDYLADLCRFDDSHFGRFKTALLTFVPPTIGGLLFPNGFIYAIGFAGLAAAFWAVIVPALMARASRKRFGSPLFRAWGGTPAIVLVLLFGVANAVAHILASLHWLPEYR